MDINTLEDFIKSLYDNNNYINDNINKTFITNKGVIKVHKIEFVEDTCFNVYYSYIDEITTTLYKEKNCLVDFNDARYHYIEGKDISEYNEINNSKWYSLTDIIDDINKEQVRLQNLIWEYNN